MRIMKKLFLQVLLLSTFPTFAEAIDVTVSLTAQEVIRLQEAKSSYQVSKGLSLTDQQFYREILRSFVVTELVEQERKEAQQTVNTAGADFRTTLDSQFGDQTSVCEVQASGFCSRGVCSNGGFCEDVSGQCQCSTVTTTTLVGP